MKNQPYVKQYDTNGNVSNPITVDKPYLHTTDETRQIRRGNQRYSYLTINGQISKFIERKTATGGWVRG